MAYEKLGKRTWVLKDTKKTLQNRYKKSGFFREKDTGKVSQTSKEQKIEEYRIFCQSIFKERKFIAVSEFNRYIREEIHTNCTWYRRRMLILGLIKVEHRVVKPGANL